ncbi:hypothetical protein [Streptomyces albireticuli]|uniref:GH18 domain-containing protein n=1 Tax=Streptomyces albireticuli TaxID=1940 RepID=A0A2A2CZ27_9ACTN|nr:hypothetical protein [Streptomyces albireticuli]MCD9143425.1 hypothetical protein [Streptomyces albireticuli]MCD9164784.1 hypothetical protein [Streptomyces albireticuli]MCD9191542.1 hypothetical protein [Streptomyces albireticuli]PAU45468.1 hypothetical protein CK936_29235 [Streptomyces albireticuli]
MKRPDLLKKLSKIRVRRPSKRLVTRLALVLTAVLVLPLAVAGSALRAAYAGSPSEEAVTRGKDAIWLGHAWVDGRKGDAELAGLKRKMAGTGLRDLYVHTGPLEHDGTLPAKVYPSASWLIDAVHRELPGVRVHAWLGDKVVRKGEGDAGLRLDSAPARAAVVASARQVMGAGFEGVHLDVEPVRTGDASFLTLLDGLRPAVRSAGGVFSVAAQQIDPVPSMHRAARAAGSPKWWTQKYFGQVARRVDQIAVMSYDTGLPLESLYGGYVARQTALALQVTPRDTDLLMGLPFYHTDSWGHHARAETAAAAVRGARLGLSREDRDRERFGLALYVDFAATDADWRAYRNGWGARG